MKSIISNEERCFICGSTLNLEWHHIFEGSLRKSSEKYGLKVRLCARCHRYADGSIRHNPLPEVDRSLKALAQKRFAEEFPDKDWLRIFHRNWWWK